MNWRICTGQKAKPSIAGTEQEVTVNAALSALADEAAARGANTSNSQVNRISFYRVAATAAWQAGDVKVVTYANEGFSLCDSENYQKAPRDCGMLSVIPGFASVDELTKRIEEIRSRASRWIESTDRAGSWSIIRRYQI